MARTVPFTPHTSSAVSTSARSKGKRMSYVDDVFSTLLVSLIEEGKGH